MKLKAVFAALSGSKRSSEKSSRRLGLEDENNSPLAPKRLLTPGVAPSSSRRGQVFADVTSSGTPRALNYGDGSPPKAGRLQREASLPRGSPTPTLSRQPSRLASTPARTPARQPSRFGPSLQQQHSDVVADGSIRMDASDNIRVVVRLRPRSEREGGMAGGSLVVQPQGSTAVQVASQPEPHSFSFDYVAGDAASQDTIFRVAGEPIVDNCLRGYNGCIFAYGQTGSGKTYTMLGRDEAAGTGASSSGAAAHRDENRGLIQRVFEHLFARITKGGGKYLLECSFLELYNETITDLLDPSRTNLHVRENLEGPYVSNLTAHEVYRVEDVVALLHTGQANRRVGETNMNERSSRSHSVFTCKLESKTVDAYGTSHIRSSRLHLVDLAGSERQKASGAQGERLKEATAINKSLSALGNVIMSLVDQQHGRTRHIPYRDSRLTYLLQDSLGGNAKTCLVATVSPAAMNVAETLSTLRFADQAKRIKNQAVVNEDTDGDKAALKREIKRLQDELLATRRMQQQQRPLAVAELSSGTPARLQATADSLLAALPSTEQEGVGRRQALMGALRREDLAVKDVARLQAELEGMKGLLKAKESDLQRMQMMLKLKESRLARMQGGASAADVPTEVAELQREVELLRGKVEAHPEVKRFAVENLHLSEELKKFESMVKRAELAALAADVGALRSEMLRLEDELLRCQEEATAAREAAATARSHAEQAAESIRLKALAEAQAKSATEASELRQQLFDQHRAGRVQEAQLGAATRDREELLARVALLQGTVAQLESTHHELRSELSPAKKRVRQYEQDLALLQQEGQAAELRASTEATMRSQAELSSGQLAARLAALEGECSALRAANQELSRAKSDAEEQVVSAASVGSELELLRGQLEREQAVANERQEDCTEALLQLEASRQHVAALEAELKGSQQSVLSAQSELQRQREEHEAAHAAAALRIAGALKAASEMQAELDRRAARSQQLLAVQDEMQARSDDLTERCTQLHADNLHVTRMLAQRDNELQEMEQSMEDKDVQLEQCRGEAARLTGELATATAALAAKASELSGAGSELEAARGKLAEATAAMRDAHDQLIELQERLSAADSQQAQLEYDLSDKSASLQEATEQVADLRRQLDCSQQSAAGLSTAAAELEHQLDAATREAAEHEAAAAAAGQQLAAREEQLAEVQAEAEQQRGAAAAAQQQAADLQAQLQVLQGGTLLEKEQQLLLGRAEVKELRQQLAEQEAAATKLQAQLEARCADIATLRHDMAAEVSEAAQQVQLLLAAQARVAVLESELAEARQQADAAAAREGEEAQQPLKVAEAVAAARGSARLELERLEQELAQRDAELASLRRQVQELTAEAEASMASAQGDDQLSTLIAEREAWIEEVQGQRAEATAAIEASRALERRFAEVAEERSGLAAALQAVQGRADVLEEELTHLTGQQNLNQRIQYHAKIKNENGQLRDELGRLRIEHHRTQARYERMAAELQKLREANGQAGLPDFEAEEALRDALVATEEQKRQLERELEALAYAVVSLAGGDAASTSAAGDQQQDDIVLEFGTPRPGAHGAQPQQQAPTAADARRALADIWAAQAAAARSLEDQSQQIRLLKEAGKLQRLRRSSSAVADRQPQRG